jgi:SPFH domain/Band 7 family protein
MAFRAGPEGERMTPRLNMQNTNPVAVAAFLGFTFAGAIGTAVTQLPYPVIAGVAIGIYLLTAIKVVRQWEKAVKLRFGRYVGLLGPGVFLIVPVIETLSQFVDQRVRVANVSAETTLTRDTVPVNVDAIIFWMVWNAEKAILEVENYNDAITMSAQTALRESIGRHDLHQALAEREMLGEARAPRPRDSGHRRNRDRRQVCLCRRDVQRQSRGSASARHEHAL